MKYSPLGSSGVDVSRICLGTMTWGKQNTQQDADQQIELALSAGINFFDTAEMYPVPPAPELYAHTEMIIGDWLKRNPERRKEMILATKIAGPGLPYIRNGGIIDGEAIIKSVDASLARLNTDYIDLYQLHWPNRNSPHFCKHQPNHIRFSNVDKAQQTQWMLEALQALKQCQDEGKIRFCGLSDESTWGINQYLKLSDKYDVPRMVSIQNEFSLLHSKDWPYLIENCVHEDIAYLPWSPIAGGALSGKYLDGARPAGSRWTLEQRNGLFRDTELANEAVRGYCEIAKNFDMTPAQLALAWCDKVDGVTSTIIGATTIAQLEENIAAFDIPYTDEIREAVDSHWRKYPMPF